MTIFQNPSICECECDKSWDVGEYLDYANCKCRKRHINKLVEKCDEDIDGNEIIYNVTLDDYIYVLINWLIDDDTIN